MPTYGSLVGTNQAFTILDSDPTTGYLDLFELPSSTVTTLTEGQTLTYEGSAQSGTGLLQNGQTYLVHVIDQDNTDNIQVQLVAQYETAASGTLTGPGHTLTINSVDTSTGILTVAEQSGATSPNVNEGETVTYTGTSGTGPGAAKRPELYRPRRRQQRPKQYPDSAHHQLRGCHVRHPQRNRPIHYHPIG